MTLAQGISTMYLIPKVLYLRQYAHWPLPTIPHPTFHNTNNIPAFAANSDIDGVHAPSSCLGTVRYESHISTVPPDPDNRWLPVFSLDSLSKVYSNPYPTSPMILAHMIKISCGRSVRDPLWILLHLQSISDHKSSPPVITTDPG